MSVTYVAGLCIDDARRVVLIEKNRPDWQAGKLNAVGGKVEAGETPHDAMVREFEEETGVRIPNWDHYATVEFDGGDVHFHRSFTTTSTLSEVRSVTDEHVQVHRIESILCGDHRTIPNLVWLLALAAYRHDTYWPVIAREK